MTTTTLPLAQVRLNDENPRIIREERFAQLVQSLIDFPEMLTLRPAVLDENGLLLGGNMRTRAKRFLLELPEAEKAERMAAAVYARREQQGPDHYHEGNHRALLAELFDAATMPVVQVLTLTQDQKDEFIIKDNAGFGEWDWDELANGRWGSAGQLNAWGVNLPPKWGEDSPDEMPERELDGPIETEHKCPSCGHEF